MVEQIFRFHIGELSRIKVTCGKCHKSIELPTINGISERYRELESGRCAFCDEPLRSETSPDFDALDSLIRAIRAISQAEKQGRVTVEFSLPIHGKAE